MGTCIEEIEKIEEVCMEANLLDNISVPTLHNELNFVESLVISLATEPNIVEDVEIQEVLIDSKEEAKQNSYEESIPFWDQMHCR